LRHRIYDRLLLALPELYAARTLDELRNATVRITDNLIGSDGSGCFEFDMRDAPRLSSVVESVPCITPAIAAKMPRTLSTHPFLSVWSRQQDPSTLKLSDFPIAVRQRHLEESAEVYKVIGSENMTAPLKIGPDSVIAVSVRRQRKAFAEHERTILELLKPHLRQARANVMFFQALAHIPEHLTARAHGATPLTERESQVAFWLAQGKTNREIAAILALAARTVEKHVESILHKLEVENRTTAALAIRARVDTPRQYGKHQLNQVV
jgi:DNA-binding CsgD family transcriptional regulator